MPLIGKTEYSNPKWLFNGHLQTIVPGLFRCFNTLPFERERINTPDGDFLDLDWLKKDSRKLVIISHGLEGNSRRPYMVGMASHFFEGGFDVLNWNFRSCGEQLNLKPIFYHSGSTYDLETVIKHAEKEYDEIFLIGFSIGGNLTLKYLGEERKLNPKIKKGVAISTPLHLESSCIKISSMQNIIYSKRFLRTLKEKIIKKSRQFPEEVSISYLSKITSQMDFDEYYTGPIHGFTGAKDYYDINSSLYYLTGIEVPSLIINALNDPFLTEKCFPIELGRHLNSVWMEFPRFGGHVGFSPRDKKENYWSDKRAFEFITRDQ